MSPDIARELYKQLNPAFVAAWKAKTGQAVTINQSHGGSTKQIGAVIGGLEADVVTMNQATDVDQLASAGYTRRTGAIAFPNGAAPYSSTMLMLVRKGQPKGIRTGPTSAAPVCRSSCPTPRSPGTAATAISPSTAA